MKKIHVAWVLLLSLVACNPSSNVADVQPRDQYIGLYKGTLSGSGFKNLYAEINLAKSSNSSDGMLIAYQNQTIEGSLYSQNKLAIFPGRLVIRDTAYSLNGDGKLAVGNVLSINFAGNSINTKPISTGTFYFIGYK